MFSAHFVELGKVEFMRKKHSGPQIVLKLRQADILIGQGKGIPEICKELDVTDAIITVGVRNTVARVLIWSNNYERSQRTISA